MNINKEQLQDKINQGFSQRKLSKHFKKSVKTIVKLLKKFELKTLQSKKHKSQNPKLYKPTTKCPQCERNINNEYYESHLLNCPGKINFLEYFTVTNDRCICKLCNKDFSKFGITNHLLHTHFGVKRNMPDNLTIWNKGLTAKDHPSIKKGVTTLKNRYENGELTSYIKGKKHTVEERNKISSAMKKAHKEGRAWNIGKSRWNNKPSYPEQFFMKAVDNEFIDKNYIREYNVGIYSLDFAWVHLKKVIEIDGEQHQRFEEYKVRDNRKDELLTSLGWSVMRIQWKDLYNEPQRYISQAKNFIDC